MASDLHSTKQCIYCKELKPLSEFKRAKRWYTNKCLACFRKHSQTRRSNPEVWEKELIANRERKRRRAVEEPLKHKATNLTNGLAWGKGATQRMMGFIEPMIGTECKYCKTLLTLKNLSLDHKVPLAHSARKDSRKTRYSYSVTDEVFVQLNSLENLQIVCLACNRAKGNLTDDEYSALLAFLSLHPRMETIVIAKLKGSNFMYRK